MKNFRKNFLESIKYIRDCKKYIYFILVVFAFSAFIGFLFPTPSFISQQLNILFKQLIEQTKNLNTLELIFFIFKNNFKVSLLGIFFGVFFCFIPFILALSNGYILGYVAKLVVGEIGGIRGILSLWRIFPHGIFELPAVIISLALGIRLGIIFIGDLNKNSLKNTKVNLKIILKVIWFIILPLLIIAAIIEGFLIKLMS